VFQRIENKTTAAKQDFKIILVPTNSALVRKGKS